MELDALERDFTNKLCAVLLVAGVPPDLSQLASERMMSGYRHYGPAEWLKVERDLARDTDEEIADAMIYLAMRAFKHGQEARLRQALYYLFNAWLTLHEGENGTNGQRGNGPAGALPSA